jgi:hypothetical protein
MEFGMRIIARMAVHSFVVLDVGHCDHDEDTPRTGDGSRGVFLGLQK